MVDRKPVPLGAEIVLQALAPQRVVAGRKQGDRSAGKRGHDGNGRERRGRRETKRWTGGKGV